MTNVILVDANDNPLGQVEKLKAHQEGLLHRAFSVFIYRKNPANPAHLETLLQQRHFQKYHSGGLWTNACCSHPLPHETVKQAAYRRLKEEMNLEASALKPLEAAGRFLYKAAVGKGLIEHELDHVLAAEMCDPFMPLHVNQNEIQALQWCYLETLKKKIAQHPHDYTVWLLQALDTWLTFYHKNPF